MAKNPNQARPGNMNATKCSPERVAEIVEELISDYLNEGIVPTDFRLGQKAGVSPRTIDSWYNGERDRGEENDTTYKSQMQRLINFRSQICQDNLASGKQATNWIFLSKQARWGGFTDSIQKMETSGKQDIKITIAGPDGKPMKGIK